MKLTNFIYGISLVALGLAIYFVVQYPESNRLQMIAGTLTGIGISLNLYSFNTKQHRVNSIER
ncbi:MAG: hypothetical protein CO119_09970 [Flavobacteriales bacterium CG_4_9_14_3_um_filter_40_17]|nr:MAG: hypothetical protein CO119_09970 [Flavobacteriales bacterium CG_4_9_14_3_um_filter_40_17]